MESGKLKKCIFSIGKGLMIPLLTKQEERMHGTVWYWNILNNIVCFFSYFDTGDVFHIKIIILIFFVSGYWTWSSQYCFYTSICVIILSLWQQQRKRSKKMVRKVNVQNFTRFSLICRIFCLRELVQGILVCLRHILHVRQVFVK